MPVQIHAGVLLDIEQEISAAGVSGSRNNYRPDPESLTLSPREQLAAYVDRQSQRLASATIRRHIASIGSVLRMSGHPDITKATPVVLSLKRMHRKKGRGPGPAGTR